MRKEFWLLVVALMMAYWAGYLGGSSDQGIIGKRVATLTAIGTKGKVLLWTLIAGLLGTAAVLGVNLIL